MSSNDKKLLSVVKIEYGGKTIYRRYQAKTCSGFKSDMFAISPNSWRMLSDNNHCPTTNCVSISSGNKFCYYWNHPFQATRLTVRLGLIGIVLTLLLSIAGIIF